MKLHPQVYEKIAKRIPTATSLNKIGSRLGSVDDLVLLLRNFYKDEYATRFAGLVKHIWLQHQFTFNGISLGEVRKNGFYRNKIYGYFMKNMVGTSQTSLMDGLSSSALLSYIPDLFPTFYDHNPFDESEYFKLPYKNISIPHMIFVYQCEKRLDMLDYADKRAMSYGDFRDWAINYVSSDTPDEYEFSFWHNSSYIKKNKKGNSKK